jgi:PPOX class probable F420-dependent enzyme
MPMENERYINLATFRRSGEPVETPVWFAELDGKLYVFSAGTAGKVKRLRNSSRAKVASCDMRGRLRGGWIDATVSIVDDAAMISSAYEALRAKYGLQMRLVDFFSRLFGRINERVFLEILIRS